MNGPEHHQLAERYAGIVVHAQSDAPSRTPATYIAMPQTHACLAIAELNATGDTNGRSGRAPAPWKVGAATSSSGSE